jgi:hypothetical protein
MATKPRVHLDLRPNGALGVEHTARLNALAHASSQAFNEAIDTATVRLKGQRSWLYSDPASRNPLSSDLWYRSAGLALAAELSMSGTSLDILTDSPACAKALVNWAKRADVAIFVRVAKPIAGSKSLLRRIVSLFGNAVWLIWVFVACRFSGPRAQLDGRELVLIDTFCLRDAPTRDRYFPGLFDCLEPDEKARTRFVPTVCGNGFKGFISMFRALRADCCNLLKEDYLKLQDILDALVKPLRSLFLRTGPIEFMGFELEGMIHEELLQIRNYSSMVIAFLNERFAMRLKRSGVRVTRTVSWFENQPVDKGWQTGFRAMFPNAVRIGYQGFVPQPLYLSLYLTPEEQAAGAAPDELAVMGSELAAQARLANGRITVRQAPAFRFRYLTEIQDISSNISGRVLVALPMNRLDALYILKLLVTVQKHVDSSAVSFFIKAHPAEPMQKLLAELGLKVPDTWQLTDQPMEHILSQSSMLVSTASSVCVEAVALGIQVALVARPGGLLLNPLPDSLRDDLWQLCKTHEELARTIQRSAEVSSETRRRHREQSSIFRNNYFIPIDRPGVLSLLGS